MENNIKTAYMYRRVSAEEAARNGISLEIQKFDIEKYCSENSIKLIGDYEDAGVSAGKSIKQRPALARMLEDMEKDKPDLLLLWRMDRLWRRVSDYYDVKKILDKINCDFFCVAEQDYDTRTPTGRLYINIKLSIAENERDQTGERITAMFRSRTERGIANGGTKTFGYDIVEDENGDRRYIVNEEEAEAVKAAFDYYINCGSVSKTSMWLRDTYGIYRTQKSLRWFLFGNAMYIGKKEVRPQGANYTDPSTVEYVVDNYCPAIIDQRTWDVAQSMLQSKDKNQYKKKYDYVFSSLLKCARCGRPITPYPSSRTQKSGNKYVYKCYRCPNGRNPSLTSSKVPCTMRKVISEGKLETAVLAEVKRQLGDHILAVEEDVNVRAVTNKTVQAKINRLQTKLSRMNELYIDSMLTREEYDSRSIGIRAEIAELEKSMITATPEQVKQMKETMAAVKSFDEVYDTLSAAEKNVLYRNIIKNIYVDTETLEMRIEFL